MSCSLNLKNISYVKEEKLLFKDINIDLGHKEKNCDCWSKWCWKINTS